MGREEEGQQEVRSRKLIPDWRSMSAFEIERLSLNYWKVEALFLLFPVKGS
ncbi:hypothetical protein GRAN_4674 [Granulicella sibirica]|uniref:Uncharacterized protein n=1 Tax=Granulicella sibirica TaxID=2479048 RepID=A0A4Q0SXN1_9BACT|nr:hypothetical protein GRAN_4674 [Granulicella sibirica]